MGAFFSHTLFVVIHEAAHNLVFKGLWKNVATGILANFPSIFPTAISFKNFHIKHHVFQGVHELDADLPDLYEAKLIKNYSIGKAIWLFFFPVFQLIRTIRYREVATVGRYVFANIAAQIAFDVAVVYFFGWTALLYLFLSFWFSVGLHPLGARWIQEHYLTLSNTHETYSYYGRVNGVNLNVGFHNEHHGMPSIPWNNLPKLKQVAPEFYEPLLAHTSYTKLFFQFLFESGNQPLLAHHAQGARHRYPQRPERTGQRTGHRLGPLGPCQKKGVPYGTPFLALKKHLRREERYLCPAPPAHENSNKKRLRQSDHDGGVLRG